MKLSAKTLIAIAFPAILFSCKKKDHTDNNQSNQRLARLEWKNAGVTSSDNFLYNSANRITSITYKENGGTPVPMYQISYNGNQMIMVRSLDEAAVFENTTSTFTLDADGKPIKRIVNHFIEFKGPNFPQRDYSLDTTIYEYDAAGLLLKETIGRYDSTWFNPGNVEIYVSHITGTSNYINGAGDISSWKRLTANKGYTKQNNQTYNWNKTEEYNYSFEYTKNNPNKMDFSNAAVLNEFGSFTFPINKNYKNIPARIIWNRVEKDANTGNVLTSSSDSFSQSLGYNKNGLLSSVSTDPSNPSAKMELIYE